MNFMKRFSMKYMTVTRSPKSGKFGDSRLVADEKDRKRLSCEHLKDKETTRPRSSQLSFRQYWKPGPISKGTSARRLTWAIVQGFDADKILTAFVDATLFMSCQIRGLVLPIPSSDHFVWTLRADLSDAAASRDSFHAKPWASLKPIWVSAGRALLKLSAGSPSHSSGTKGAGTAIGVRRS